MPIIFRCAGCGSLNRVGDDVAGKAVRCGKCQAVLTAPAAGTPAPAAPEPPPAPVAEEKVARESAAPTKTSRPREADEDDEPRPRRRETDEDDEPRPRRRKDRDDEDEDEPRSRRRKDKEDEAEDLPRPRNLLKARQRKKSRVGLILALVGVGLLSFGGLCAGVIWHVWDQARSQIAQAVGDSIYEGGGPEAKSLPALEDIRDGKFAKPPRATTPTTYFRMVSSKGDYIGQGKTYSYAAHDMKVRTKAHVLEVEVGPWQADFWGADKQVFKPGEYPDARRMGEGVDPGIDVHGEGRGCNQTKGKFIVWELAIVGDQVVRLAIDFVQHCEGNGPPLYGRIRFNSSFE
jgi:hypothetical protein